MTGLQRIHLRGVTSKRRLPTDKSGWLIRVEVIGRVMGE